jgi:hypothetical protein
MNNSVIKYTGTVNIDTTHKKYVKKNSGTRHLFRLFSSVLSRQPYNALSLPAYLMLYDLSTVSDKNVFLTNAMDDAQYRVLKSFVDLNSYAVAESYEYETEFTATLTASMLRNKLDNPHNLVLAVVAGNQQALLATITFDHRVFTTIQEGGQAVVRWQMRLTNGDEESFVV